MDTFETITHFNMLAGSKLERATDLLKEIADRFSSLQKEKGVKKGSGIENLEGDEIKNTLFLRGYTTEGLSAPDSIENLAKAMALIDIGDVPKELHRWIRPHTLNSAMALITCPDLAFQHHIPTEAITAKVKRLMELYLPLSDKVGNIPLPPKK